VLSEHAPKHFRFNRARLREYLHILLSEANKLLFELIYIEKYHGILYQFQVRLKKHTPTFSHLNDCSGQLLSPSQISLLRLEY